MVDRRSYLKLTGGALTAGIAGGVITLVARNEGGGGGAATFEEREIEYDAHDDPSDVYRVWTGYPERFAFEDGAAYTGATALRCDIPAGDSDGSNAMVWFPDEGYDQPRALYQRAMISLSDDWTMEETDVCRFWCAGLNTEAGIQGSGSRGRPHGDDGWSSMFAVTDREIDDEATYNLAAYSYHMDQEGISGEFEVVGAPVPTGKWFRFETLVRMNTVSDGTANPDGEVRCWLNGTPVYERTDFRWTTTEDQAIEYGGPLVRYGGNETAPADLAIYYDDHELRGNGAIEDRLESDPYVEDSSRMDDYDGRITVATGDAETSYRIYVDGYVVHSEWSNVDGHTTTPNETVEIALADTTKGYATADAVAAPESADGYLYDGSIVAVDAVPELAELWVDGQELDPAAVPSRPGE
ncbi:hypothetical protein [Haloterrigena salifodinae]|uniref:hypothetical protein n=1 Tax=Haloterrigena salifodinae TaxID=2675099 RepID=UPI000F869DE3|nr:hypothetical protein [Haloterrigena salifodinae]